MTPNRIVALVTPVCALAAGWAASWLAENVPGLDVSADSLQAVFIAGAVAVLAPALHWLHGWQKFEARQAEDERLATALDAAGGAPDDADLEDFELPADELEELDDLEDLEELEDEVAVEDAETVVER